MANASSLTAFLKENKIEKAPKQVYVTDSFLDGNGKPILWKIKPISSEVEKQISDSVVITKTDRRTGTVTQIRDDAEYLARLSAAAVVFPDLADDDLQSSYGVDTQTKLLRQMLSVGELVKLAEEVMKVSGLDVDDNVSEKEMEADIKFAKN